ncbi:MAG: glycosyltransferase, partial [Solirubrobacteraceae bacterium]
MIAGGDADLTAADLRRLAAGAGVHDRVHVLGPVDQEIVPALYEGADAVAYVSLYETFGHPVLEALAFGKPVLTSSEGATAEVGGAATCLVDPSDVADIAGGLRTVALDAGARARLSAAGPARARDFTWAACAEGSVAASRRAVPRQKDDRHQKSNAGAATPRS